MARYRRRFKRRSTNIIRMKFQSFMDISTNDTSMQVITISAGGKEILRRLGPQFGAYKYYKVGNIAVKLVPASTLPTSPSGLGYEVGEPTVDPRDQLTPGMMRITNGEDVFEDISGLSDDQQHAIYNNMLLDPRWFKWMLQSGVKRHATPRYWQVGQLHQDKWPGSIVNVPLIASAGNDPIAGTATFAARRKAGDADYFGSVSADSSSHGLFQVGHRGVLGWLPTDGLVKYYDASNNLEEESLLASPPEVEVMKIILPKAYKTRYYYRMFITETVYFKEPIVNFGVPYNNGFQDIYLRPLDVFHRAGYPSPMLPSFESSDLSPSDANTGGNYGDD